MKYAIGIEGLWWIGLAWVIAVLWGIANFVGALIAMNPVVDPCREGILQCLKVGIIGSIVAVVLILFHARI